MPLFELQVMFFSNLIITESIERAKEKEFQKELKNNFKRKKYTTISTIFIFFLIIVKINGYKLL